MFRAGFSLIEIIVFISILAVLFGGGLYFKSLQNQFSTIKTGVSAEEKALEVNREAQTQAKPEQNTIDQLNNPPPTNYVK